jgi:hypothetical protein
MSMGRESLEINDLILLLECADKCGFEHVHARPGFEVAQERLLEAELVEWNPNEEGAIRIRMRGYLFVEKILDIEP